MVLEFDVSKFGGNKRDLGQQNWDGVVFKHDRWFLVGEIREQWRTTDAIVKVVSPCGKVWRTLLHEGGGRHPFSLQSMYRMEKLLHQVCRLLFDRLRGICLQREHYYEHSHMLNGSQHRWGNCWGQWRRWGRDLDRIWDFGGDGVALNSRSYRVIHFW